MAYVITGSPGTGKHTISAVLGRDLGLPVLDISAEAERLGAAERGEVDTRMLSGAMRPPERCVLVGHLAPHVADPDSVSAAAVLRRSPYELEGVYRARGYPRRKSLENLGAEILGVVAGEAAAAFGERAVQVDVTGSTIPRSCRDTLRALRGEGRGADVDWLGEVCGRGDIRRFFEHSPP